jgi:hypothetical protein
MASSVMRIRTAIASSVIAWCAGDQSSSQQAGARQQGQTI